MASALTPAAVVQNENIHVHGGKADNAVGKSELNKQKKKRKALEDLSKTKGTTIKTRVVPNAKQSPATAVATIAATNKPSILPDPYLTEEDIRKCKEWAKEGIERLHCPCNHLQQFEDDVAGEVIEELGMVMPSSGRWIPRDDDPSSSPCKIRPNSPPMEDPRDFGPIGKLELEPEAALPNETRFPSFTGAKDLELELAELWEFDSFNDVELILKDSDDEVTLPP